jgi:hypothetical protein
MKEKLKELLMLLHVKLTEPTEFSDSLVPKRLEQIRNFNKKNETRFWIHIKKVGESRQMSVTHVTINGKFGPAIWEATQGFLIPDEIPEETSEPSIPSKVAAFMSSGYQKAKNKVKSLAKKPKTKKSSLAGQQMFLF